MKKLTAIKRVCRMERYYCELIMASKSLIKRKTIIRKKHILEEYMISGLWLKDYELDEKGKFPDSLKRGVLSEDGLYNLLSKTI